MKATLFVLVLLCSFTLSAQNWQLVTPGSPYFFKGDTTGLTMGIEIRSQHTQGNVIVYRFNNSVPDRSYGRFDIGLDYEDASDTIFYMPTIIGAEMHVHPTGDVFLMDTAQAIEFLIRPAAVTGAEWTFDSSKSIKATVSQVYMGLVKGVSDSLKRISLSNGQEIVLSRSYGIAFTPNLFPVDSKYVVRYSQIADNRLTKRQMNDFSVGDVIHTSYNGGWRGSTSRLDTVISKTVSIDSTTVTYEVKRLEGNSVLASTDTVTWNLNYSDSFFSPHLPGELYYTNNDYMPVRGYYYYDSTGKYGVPYHHHVMEWHWSFRYTQQLAGVGSLYYASPESEPSDNYRSLAYYKKGNKTWGDPIFVGAGAEVTSVDFSLYPNPANHWLMTKGLPYGTRVQIMDLTGRVLIEEPFTGNIQVSTLTPGAYVLKLENGARKRFQISR